VRARLVPTFAVLYVAGHLARRTSGNAPVVISGTPSIPRESVRLAYMRGRQPSACAVIAGRRILTGMPDLLSQLTDLVAVSRHLGAAGLSGLRAKAALGWSSASALPLLLRELKHPGSAVEIPEHPLTPQHLCRLLCDFSVVPIAGRISGWRWVS